METNQLQPIPALAASITKSASKQTYYTVRFLVDRARVTDAYQAYAYFRWVDDHLDSELSSVTERATFIQRQKLILANSYRGEYFQDLTPQEQMLVELIRNDPQENGGLHSYLFNMMAVMAFDAERRGRLISQNELNEYTCLLATAITDAMHYFIGHDCPSPSGPTRILAVSAAHIAHMLRDTFDDAQAGYFNIPSEVLEENHINPQDVASEAYRAWVQNRVQLARKYFKLGGEYLSRVGSLRCRLAGFAYRARFEWLLDTIEREKFILRPTYDERKSLGTGLRMGVRTMSSMINWRSEGISKGPVSARAHPEGKP